MPKDDYLIVLDFLPYGKPGDRRAEPIAQGIGDQYFNLLEVVIKEGIHLKPKDRVYIGPEKREEVKYVKGRIKYQDLTTLAKENLKEVLKEIVEKEEKRFVDFFNRAGPITTRLHSLELLPGIGKKHMWEIIQQRKKKLFESFEELQKRIPMLPNPKRIIVERILEELQEKDRHRLFVAR